MSPPKRLQPSINFYTSYNPIFHTLTKQTSLTKDLKKKKKAILAKSRAVLKLKDLDYCYLYSQHC